MSDLMTTYPLLWSTQYAERCMCTCTHMLNSISLIGKDPTNNTWYFNTLDEHVHGFNVHMYMIQYSDIYLYIK